MSVWLVSRFSNKITEKDQPPKRVGMWATHDDMWPVVFVSRDDAVAYILERAQKEIDIATVAVRVADKRLKNAQKKLAKLQATFGPALAAHASKDAQGGK